ncbi:leukocyte surface antigen CD53 isoform X1 [Diabrotica virgifera virgifera]|uniref:Tetraspanin n=1 Tax=Diabrotica virgifera virgifera TaxID=50390 RepID=A0A6P7H9S7_DIAVI|nr:leukocyte surface antigen CD53 isoform X1 [Diabrotica virgifera virgifera]
MIKMGCDEDILKCLVFWTNFILALVGISLISLGIIYKINLEELAYALPKEYGDLSVIPVLTIPLGTILIILAVFGCYGCLTERMRYVILYIATLLVIFVLQQTLGINAFCRLKNDTVFRNRLDNTLLDIFEHNDQDSNKAVTDLIQHRLKCCGFNGSEYWNDTIPKSCHKTDSSDIFDVPCNDELFKYIKHCQRVLGVSITLLSVAEVIAAVVSLYFVYHLRSKATEFVFIKDYSFQDDLL